MKPEPSTPEPFATETMAELCARQGRLGDAIAIYRKLREAAPAASRARWDVRLAELERAWQQLGGAASDVSELPIPAAPGVLAQPGDGEALVSWAVPSGTPAPALEVLLILRTLAGVETERRLLPVEAVSGRVAVTAPGLHSVVAAVGRLGEGGRFVPLARSPRA